MATSLSPVLRDLVFVVFAFELVLRGFDLRPLGDGFFLAEVVRLADFDLEEAGFFATGFFATGNAPLGWPGDRAGRLVKFHR